MKLLHHLTFNRPASDPGHQAPPPAPYRSPEPAAPDVVSLTTAERAAILHAIAQLDGKATQKKVRRAAESVLGAPEGALDEKKQAVKELCREEVMRLEALRPPAKKLKVASSTDSEQPVADAAPTTRDMSLTQEQLTELFDEDKNGELSATEAHAMAEFVSLRHKEL